MAKKRMWQVSAGESFARPDDDMNHETTHVYNSPKTAVKVARRYMSKSTAHERHLDAEDGVETRRLHSGDRGKNSRTYHADEPGFSDRYARVSKAKGFAFRD